MYKHVSFVTPYAYRNQQRHANFMWAQNRMKHFYPDSEFVIGETDIRPFSRANAINNGVKKATREIVVIIDSDFIFEPELIDMAINKLETSAWVIPFTRVFDLTDDTTNRVLCSDVGINLYDMQMKGYKHEHEAVGSINVMRKSDFISTGGLDESTCGWGYDDNIFAHIASVILGDPKRVNADTFHLYHDYEADYRNDEISKRNFDYYRKVISILDKNEMIEFIKIRDGGMKHVKPNK